MVDRPTTAQTTPQHPQRRRRTEQMTAPITLHRLNPDDLSSYTRSRLRHLTNGSALYIPGSPAAEFQPHHPPRLYRHPYTSTQMPLLEGTFNTLTSDDILAA